MSAKVTMQDIADKLGITKVSVSKALGNKPGVSEALRKTIVEAASQMGYVIQNQSEKKNFLFIVPKRFFLETESFYSEIFYYLNKFCIENRHQLTPIVLNERTEAMAEWPIYPDSFDGIYLVGDIADGYVRMLAGRPVPTVAVDFYKPFLDVDYVLIDNFYLGYHATNFLIANGHKEIGFIGNINQTSSINDRYFGFQKALQNNGLRHELEWVFANNDPATGLYDIDIVFPKTLPTAFVCHCDMAAFFLTNSLKKIGKTVPDDVSLISFDNTELSSASDLTSMDINRKEVAETAFYAMESINSTRRRYYISTQLVKRASVRRV